MNLNITLKPHYKYVISNSHSIVISLTHATKFNNSHKTTLFIYNGEESLPIATLLPNEDQQKLNLNIFINKDQPYKTFLSVKGSSIDLFGVLDYEEDDNPLNLITIEGEKQNNKNKTDKEREEVNSDEDVFISTKEEVSLEDLLKNKQNDQIKKEKGFALTNLLNKKRKHK